MFKGHFLKTAFTPPKYWWGAEALEGEWRIVCVKQDRMGEMSVAHHFAGSRDEANAFARKHYLKFKGLQTAVSHLPYKLTFVDELDDGLEAEWAAAEEKLRPAGLKSEDVTFQFFLSSEKTQNGTPTGPLLLHIREAHLKDFMDELPEETATIPFLTVSAMAYHKLFSGQLERGSAAALIAEENYTHILIYRDRELLLAVKCFMGWAQATESGEIVLREIKKILTYYLESKLLQPGVVALYLFKDGPERQFDKILSGLRIPLKSTVPPPFVNGLDANCYGALGMALLNQKLDKPAEKIPLLPSIGEKNSGLSESRKKWTHGSTRLAQISGLGGLVVLITIGLIHIASLGLQFWLKDEKAWSVAEREKLEALSVQRSLMESKIQKVQDALLHRTRLSESSGTIASALPDRLWFHNWNVEAKADGSFLHTITGYCFSEGQVSDLMGRLEKTGTFKSVKLKSTESIPGRVIQKKTGLSANRQDLIQFTLQVME